MNPYVADGTHHQSAHTALSVNLNKVALIRNARQIGIPSVVHLATLALQAGAQGITIHPRPDERHIRAHDVTELGELMSRWPHAEYNIEGNPLHNLMDVVRTLKRLGLPVHQATLVPDSRDQSTSDHGWSLPRDSAVLQPIIAELSEMGVRVSLFMDPIAESMPEVCRLGAQRVELYTEAYARAHSTSLQARVLAQYKACAEQAQGVGLGVNAGHDLNQKNLADLLQAIPGVREVSIGHALISDALEWGITETVRAYLRCMRLASGLGRPSVGPR